MGSHIDIDKYVNIVLSGGEDMEARQHLETCAECREKFDKAYTTLRGRKVKSATSVFLKLVENLARSSFSLLIPSYRKSFAIDEPARETDKGKEKSEPLRVFLPRSKTLFQSPAGKFMLIFFVTVTALIMPFPGEVAPVTQRAIAAFVFTGSILALQPISLPLAALMVPVVLIILNVADVNQSFETFSRPVVFLILASLFLAEALSRHGLTKRLAMKTIIASGGDIKRLLFGIMALSAFLSMWVENTATAAVLIPVALTISREIKDSNEARKVLILLVLGIAYSASLGGMVTIMGSASNAVASGFLARLQPWTFLDWTKLGLPPFLLLLPLTWYLLLKLIPVNLKEINVNRVRANAKAMGEMKAREKEILVVISVAIIFWIGGAQLEKFIGLPSTLLSSSVVAVAAVLYLSSRQIITWDDIKNVSWGIFLIIGAGLSLGETLNRAGATEWFAHIIAPMITEPPFFVTLLLVVFLSAILTNILNNTTIAAVLVPVMINVAESNPGYNAVQLVLPLTLATTFGYSLPSASGRMALIGASGIVTPGEMLKYGLVATFFSALVLALVFYLFSLTNFV